MGSRKIRGKQWLFMGHLLGNISIGNTNRMGIMGIEDAALGASIRKGTIVHNMRIPMGMGATVAAGRPVGNRPLPNGVVDCVAITVAPT